jgi:hypothetical protein
VPCNHSHILLLCPANSKTALEPQTKLDLFAPHDGGVHCGYGISNRASYSSYIPSVAMLMTVASPECHRKGAAISTELGFSFMRFNIPLRSAGISSQLMLHDLYQVVGYSIVINFLLQLHIGIHYQFNSSLTVIGSIRPFLGIRPVAIAVPVFK